MFFPSFVLIKIYANESLSSCSKCLLFIALFFKLYSALQLLKTPPVSGIFSIIDFKSSGVFLGVISFFWSLVGLVSLSRISDISDFEIGFILSS